MEMFSLLVVAALIMAGLIAAFSFICVTWVRVAQGQQNREEAKYVTLGLVLLVGFAGLVIGIWTNAGIILPESLHAAALQGDTRAVIKAISRGADVNGRTNEGMTPLMSAAINGHPATVKALLRAGADPQAVDNDDGRTALDFALQYGHKDVAKVLLVSAAESDPLRRSIIAGKPHDLLTALASVGSRPKSALVEPLMCAVRLHRADMVAILLANDADVNSTDRSGVTALHYAVGNGDVEITKILLKAGAHANVKNRFGETALGTAQAHGRAAPSHSNREIITLLQHSR